MPRLYAGIRRHGRVLETVGCHLSHRYPSGSSLYFTFRVSGTYDRYAETCYLVGRDKTVRSRGRDHHSPITGSGD